MKASDLAAARRAELSAQEATAKERKQQIEAEQARLIREVYQPAAVALLVGMDMDAEEIAAGVKLTEVTFDADGKPRPRCTIELSLPGFMVVSIAAQILGNEVSVPGETPRPFHAKCVDGYEPFTNLADALCFAQAVTP